MSELASSAKAAAAQPELTPFHADWKVRALESGLIPDWLIRQQIRGLLAQRLSDEDKGGVEAQQQHLMQFIRQMDSSPVALNTADANAQHYEVPTRFYQLCLGKRLKYSSAYFPEGCRSLDEAEEAMLALTCERALLQDGDEVLELGCGWGSLSLYMAEKFPKAKVLGVSNSRTQKEHIDAQARSRGFKNLEIVTADMNVFTTQRRFDRVVSVEMFEHMRNWRALLAKVAGFMQSEATLFIHIFTHARFAYPFEVRDASDWMSQYFFTGGMMPSDDLPLYFQEQLRIADHWQVSGRHYQETAEAWLRNMDAHKAEIMPLFAETYGSSAASQAEKQKAALRWWVYWRVFYMACAELWGYGGGNEWLVSHYLFQKQ